MTFEMPRAGKPEDVGLSSARLQRVCDTLTADIDKGLVPGAVVLIARRGKIVCLDALWLPGSGSRRRDESRYNLSHRLNDKAVHFGRNHDAG